MMEKMKMQSLDVVGGNVERIAALFPQCVTERLGKDGRPQLAIDFGKLRAELSDEAVEGDEERIRRAGRKIKEEAGLHGQDLDIGFRVLKLDTSNMEDVYYSPDQFEPNLLESVIDNIKPDRSGEDLLFQVMLDLGIELSARIERKEIAGKEVFSADEDYLLACFDADVSEAVIEEMAKLHPTHLVIRDAGAASDSVIDNFDQIIAACSDEKKITCHIL